MTVAPWNRNLSRRSNWGRGGSAWQSPMRFARRIGGKRSETLELQGFWRNCLPKPVIHLGNLG